MSKQISITEYTVLDIFLSPLFYGDNSKLSEKELTAWNKLDNDARFDKPTGFYFAHWSSLDNDSFYAKCEITGFFGNCTKIEAVYL